MSDRAAFIAAIAAAPDDDLPRLVFADWLDEHDDPARAEFIRLQVATYRECMQFPPLLDAAKYDRIRELFEAHGEGWLRAVYDPLGVPPPDVWRKLPPAAEPTTLVGRVLRGAFRALNPFLSVARELYPFTDSVHYYSMMVFTAHAGLAPPVRNLFLARGFVGTLTLTPGQLPASASLAAAFAAEPITSLTLHLAGDVAEWERVDGPHLNRLRFLTFSMLPADDLRRLADVICRSPHLTRLEELQMGARHTFEGNQPRVADMTGVIDALRRATFRASLRRLTLGLIPGASQFLAEPGTGLDLRELTLGGPADPEPDVLANLSRMPFRDRLTKLSLDHVSCDADRFAAGPPWAALETLWLTGNGWGDAGATALAAGTAFPALRTLWVRSNEIADAGAAALARSQWVRRLKELNLDLNPISDAGATAMGEALDAGLGRVSLSNTQVSPGTRDHLRRRFGPRISFDLPPTDVSRIAE